MAIDPSISLGVRFPQIPIPQFQTPLERFQRVQSLRNLMAQGQAYQANLEQTALENEALRLKAVQTQEQAAREAQFRTRASQLQPGESITPGEAYGLLGAGPGGELLRAQAQQEVAANNLKIQQLEKLQAAAFASTDAATRTRNVMALVNAKIVPWQMARDILASPYDRKEIEEFGYSALNAKDQLVARNAELEKQHQAQLRPLQIREQTQKVEGTAPLTEYQRRQLENSGYGTVRPYPEPVFEQKKELALLGAPKLLTPAEEAQKIRIAQATAEAKPASEAENRSLGFYDRATDANRTLDELQKYMSEKGPAGMLWYKNMPNFMQPEDNQRYATARRIFTEAYLRRDSGAAISPSEYENADRAFFPQVGDQPKNLADKARARKVVIDGLKTSAARAYSHKYGEDKPQPSGGARHLIEINGKRYRYKGSGATDDLSNYDEVK